MNRFTALGLGAAAVALTVFVGARFFGSDSGIDVGSQPTAKPSPTSAAEPTPENLLPSGRLQLWNAQGDKGVITVTIPGPGWYGQPDLGYIVKGNNPDAQDGGGLIVFAETNQLFSGNGDLYVYGDPCHWASTKPRKPVTTVAAAIAALSSQPSRDASTAVPITIGGHSGKSITLQVPANAVFSDCDQGEYRSWIEGPNGARYHQAPGQIDKLWILDVGDPLGLVIFDMGYFAQTPQAVLDEIEAIAESATFD